MVHANYNLAYGASVATSLFWIVVDKMTFGMGVGQLVGGLILTAIILKIIERKDKT